MVKDITIIWVYTVWCSLQVNIQNKKAKNQALTLHVLLNLLGPEKVVSICK